MKKQGNKLAHVDTENAWKAAIAIFFDGLHVMLNFCQMLSYCTDDDNKGGEFSFNFSTFRSRSIV